MANFILKQVEFFNLKMLLFFFWMIMPISATAISPAISYLLSGSTTTNPPVVDTDSDGDGVLDSDDKWPYDNTKPVLSQLWGAYGEKWDATNRLPFVGMAGYRDGAETPINVRVVANVTNYGATAGVGTSLDSNAFRDAITYAKTQVDANNPGVIYVPAGIYEVEGQIHLDKSGLILKGAGRDQTKIHFINHIDGQVSALIMGGDDQGHSGFNWQHNVYNSTFSSCLDNANLPSKGDFQLHLDKTMSTAFKNNLAAQKNRVRLAQWLNRTNGGSTPKLLEQIYGGSVMEPEASGNTFIVQEFTASIIDDQTLKMDRPLRFTPTDELHYNQPACVSLRDTSVNWETEEIGVEDLTVWFEPSDFQGHDGVKKEGIGLRSNHSWVKNVLVENADNAIINFPGTSHNTVSNVIVDANRGSPFYGPGIPYDYKIAGHAGISAYGSDHLIEDFDIRFSYIHDISTKDSQGCVFSNGKAVEMNMDHHRQVIYSSVWTQLDLGVAHRLWDSTGDGPEGFQAASFNTYWNIMSEDPTLSETAPVWPGEGNWFKGTQSWGYYQQNYIAFKGLSQKPATSSNLQGEPYFDPDDIYLEAIDINEVWPENIHKAQRDAYLKGKLW